MSQFENRFVFIEMVLNIRMQSLLTDLESQAEDMKMKTDLLEKRLVKSKDILFKCDLKMNRTEKAYVKTFSLYQLRK